MKVFIYSLRDYDEQDFMVEFCSQYGLEYGYTAETPCMDNLHMAFYTDEAVSNMMENSLSGIKDFFETGACVNR